MAQTMPPAALKTRKRGHGILFVPARNAAHVRRIDTNRPQKTTLPPWRRNSQIPILSRLSCSPILWP